LNSGRITANGKTTSKRVKLPVIKGERYRMEVTGHKKKVKPVTKKTEVRIAFPPPTNLRYTIYYRKGWVKFSWTPPRGVRKVRYTLWRKRFERAYKPPGFSSWYKEKEGITTSNSVTFFFRGWGYKFSVSAYPCGEEAVVFIGDVIELRRFK
jgi:hypothetical protein